MPTRRYSFVPVLTILLQVAAVMIFVVFAYQSIHGFGEAIQTWTKGAAANPYFGGGGGPVKGFGPRLESLLSPLSNFALGLIFGSLSWGFGVAFHALREIEFSVRDKSATAAITEKTPTE
jgi:hypothetical protein